MLEMGERTARIWPPKGEIRAICLALHGLGDHAGAFEHPGLRWAERGILTVAYDQRGFGKRTDRGSWGGIDAMSQEAQAALRGLAESYPGKPLFLLGESLGGAIALRAAQQMGRQMSGLALVCPAFLSSADLGWGKRTGLAILGLLPEMSLGGGFLGDIARKGGFAKATDNPKEKARLRGERILLSLPSSMLRGAAEAAEEAYHSRAPEGVRTLALTGRKDRIVPPGAIERWAKNQPSGQVRLALYPEGWHSLLRSLSGEDPLEDLACWMLTECSVLPSGAEILR